MYYHLLYLFGLFTGCSAVLKLSSRRTCQREDSASKTQPVLHLPFHLPPSPSSPSFYTRECDFPFAPISSLLLWVRSSLCLLLSLRQCERTRRWGRNVRAHLPSSFPSSFSPSPSFPPRSSNGLLTYIHIFLCIPVLQGELLSPSSIPSLACRAMERSKETRAAQRGGSSHLRSLHHCFRSCR